MSGRRARRVVTAAMAVAAASAAATAAATAAAVMPKCVEFCLLQSEHHAVRFYVQECILRPGFLFVPRDDKVAGNVSRCYADADVDAVYTHIKCMHHTAPLYVLCVCMRAVVGG